MNILASLLALVSLVFGALHFVRLRGWLNVMLLLVRVLPGALVGIRSRRGSVQVRLRRDDGMPRGTVFMPFAYVEAAANLLTNAALDPFGKIPEFKYCAVAVEVLQATGEGA